jgi:hypothetical protein
MATHVNPLMPDATSDVSPARRSPFRRISLALLATLLAVTGVAVGTPSPAAADVGHSVCLTIFLDGDGFMGWRHARGCGPSGAYHINAWVPSTGFNVNAGHHNFFGAQVDGRFPIGAPHGSTACAELWYHKPNGGYGSYGLPCARVN